MGRPPSEWGGAPFSSAATVECGEKFWGWLKMGRPPSEWGGARFARSKEEGVVRSLRKRRRFFFMIYDMSKAKNFCTVKGYGVVRPANRRRRLLFMFDDMIGAKNF